MGEAMDRLIAEVRAVERQNPNHPEYTPTTEDIRDALAMACEGVKSQAEFDRWLQAHDVEVASEAAERERAQNVAQLRDRARYLNGAAFMADLVQAEHMIQIANEIEAGEEPPV